MISLLSGAALAHVATRQRPPPHSPNQSPLPRTGRVHFWKSFLLPECLQGPLFSGSTLSACHTVAPTSFLAARTLGSSVSHFCRDGSPHRPAEWKLVPPEGAAHFMSLNAQVRGSWTLTPLRLGCIVAQDLLTLSVDLFLCLLGTEESLLCVCCGVKLDCFQCFEIVQNLLLSVYKVTVRLLAISAVAVARLKVQVRRWKT